MVKASDIAKFAERWVPWAVSAAALVLLLRAMLGQAAIQADLNLAMEGVLGNAQSAGALTRETSEALTPLSVTADTLTVMNARLRVTHRHLNQMNGSLDRVLHMQQALLQRLESLSERTAGVTAALDQIDVQNRALLGATAALAEQTTGQADALEHLSDLTEESIGMLRSVNHRIDFMR